MSPLLSIVLPVLNNAAVFKKALDSVLDQTEATEIEIIVIDGGSTDGTLEVISSNSDKIAHWESGLDSGIADAFNRGIKRASGDVVGILNSDDVLESSAFINLIRAIEREPEAEVYYGAIRYYDPERKSFYIRRPNLSKMHFRMSIFHPALFVRRCCYDRIGLYDESFSHAMDSEWCHRAIAAGVKFCKVSPVLATMALGGVSDREFTHSLREYRTSVIKYKLAGRVTAYSYFCFFCLMKTVMKMEAMQPLKRIRDRWLA